MTQWSSLQNNKSQMGISAKFERNRKTSVVAASMARFESKGEKTARPAASKQKQASAGHFANNNKH